MMVSLVMVFDWWGWGGGGGGGEEWSSNITAQHTMVCDGRMKGMVI